MTRLIVIAGPANSGKMPLARKLMAEENSLCLVHRDDIRRIIVGKVDEWIITQIMHDTAKRLLEAGLPVIVCAWNLEKADMDLWARLSHTVFVPLVWLDVRAPEVAVMIPPMEEEKNA